MNQFQISLDEWTFITDASDVRRLTEVKKKERKKKEKKLQCFPKRLFESKLFCTLKCTNAFCEQYQKIYHRIL